MKVLTGVRRASQEGRCLFSATSGPSLFVHCDFRTDPETERCCASCCSSSGLVPEQLEGDRSSSVKSASLHH